VHDIVLFVACGSRHRAVWYMAIASVLYMLQPTAAVKNASDLHSDVLNYQSGVVSVRPSVCPHGTTGLPLKFEIFFFGNLSRKLNVTRITLGHFT
jgi:hypothetical protein